MNFRISPNLLTPFVPGDVELELYNGSACISLVTVAMRRFRSPHPSVMGSLTSLISEQRFLNLRTYVKWGNERGALFLHGWLSRPWAIPMPSGLLGLPCDFAVSEYRHEPDSENISGKISAGGANLSYRATIDGTQAFEPCPHGSLAEFAMERYSGFFLWGKKTRLFRVWHSPWLQKSMEVKIDDIGLVTRRFPWIDSAELVSASLTQGIADVWLGNARTLDADLKYRARNRHHRLGSLFEMP